MAKTKKQRAELLKRLRRLADGRVNDAVKLAFVNGESGAQLDELDLGRLVELKKSEKVFEARFVDQIKVLEMMNELMEECGAEEAEEFFQALNGAAGGDEG